MYKLKLIISAIAFIVFAGISINYIVTQNNKLNLKSIEVKSLGSEIKELDSRYDTLNKDFEKANEEKTLNKQKVDELNQQKLELENEKQRLEQELQARQQSKLQDASVAVANKITNTSSTSATSGNYKSWMTQAGIPQSDWFYVDCVINGCQGVSAEGGWSGTQRWNTAGSGSYGLCQALPASKMASAGSDYMTNPVTQLKWCHGYAQAYGGWAKAWEFRKCTGKCFSTRTNSTPFKSHTWW